MRLIARYVLVLVSLILGAGCRSGAKDAAPQPREASAPVSSQATASDALTPRPPDSAARETALRAAVPSPEDVALEAAIGRARRALAKGDIAGAVGNYEVAIDQHDPPDSVALGELAFVELTHDQTTPEAAVEAFMVALAAGPDLRTAGQLWFNVGLAHERAGLAELARAAWARSVASHPTSAAADRLRGKSRCQAVILDVPSEDRFPGAQTQIVKGWSGVCTALGVCSESTNESEARRRACVTSSGSAMEEDPTHGCVGDPPWESTYQHMHFSDGHAFIMPAGADRFFVGTTREGSWPAVCRGYTQTSWTLRGSVVVEVTAESALVESRTRSIPQGDPEHGRCWAPLDVEVTRVHETETARRLATVAVWGVAARSAEVTARVTDDGKYLELEGGGCDTRLRLDGSGRTRR